MLLHIGGEKGKLLIEPVARVFITVFYSVQRKDYLAIASGPDSFILDSVSNLKDEAVCAIATVDTKGEEIAYVARRVKPAGSQCLLFTWA